MGSGWASFRGSAAAGRPLRPVGRAAAVADPVRAPAAGPDLQLGGMPGTGGLAVCGLLEGERRPVAHRGPSRAPARPRRRGPRAACGSARGGGGSPARTVWRLAIARKSAAAAASAVHVRRVCHRQPVFGVGGQDLDAPARGRPRPARCYRAAPPDGTRGRGSPDHLASGQVPRCPEGPRSPPIRHCHGWVLCTDSALTAFDGLGQARAGTHRSPLAHADRRPVAPSRTRNRASAPAGG